MGCKNNYQIKLAPKDNVVNTYFGIKVTDNYRYMENSNDSIYINWLKSQKHLAEKTLKKIPKRKVFLNELDAKKNDNLFSISKINITDSHNYFYLRLYVVYSG